MSESKNIYQRINDVMKEVAYVKKDATVTTYKAVTHDNVTAVLRPNLVKAGIVVQASQRKGKMLQMRDLSADVKQHLYCGDYTISFVNVDNPEDKLSVDVQAHATDTADKAPSKCISMATKYAMLKTFSLETGENEEGRYHETPLFTDAQKARFDEILQERDGLAYACFSKEMGNEAMMALQDTFPAAKDAGEGELAKSAGKQACKELEAEGWATIKDYAFQIKERIENNDPSVLELTGELHGTEKRMVAGLLTESEVAHLAKLKELGA
jgi:hypothetical protein